MSYPILEKVGRSLLGMPDTEGLPRRKDRAGGNPRAAHARTNNAHASPYAHILKATSVTQRTATGHVSALEPDCVYKHKRVSTPGIGRRTGKPAEAYTTSGYRTTQVRTGLTHQPGIGRCTGTPGASPRSHRVSDEPA